MTTLIISNEEMYDIMKIVKSLEESSLMIKGVSEAFRTETKDQNSGFLGILLSTLAANVLGSMLAGKGVIQNR